MATQPRALDVWLVEANKVYKEVPYNVVTDWVQQGRLLEEDKVRPAGGGDWQRVADGPLAAYLPKPEPHRAEDRAEALEPVSGGLTWRHRTDEGEEEIDMIPLIDISLVLLIFFVFNATKILPGVLGPSGGLPKAEAGAPAEPRGLWVRIDFDPKKQKEPIYSVGKAGQPVQEGDDKLKTLPELLQRLDALLPPEGQPPVEVTVNAVAATPSGLVRDLVVKLEEGPRRGRIIKKFTGVSMKAP
jgi:biopolymer transport protein ExbD